MTMGTKSFYHHADREHYRTVWVLSSWGKEQKTL